MGHLVWTEISSMLMSIAMGMCRRIEVANNWFTKVNILVHMFLLWVTLVVLRV